MGMGVRPKGGGHQEAWEMSKHRMDLANDKLMSPMPVIIPNILLVKVYTNQHTPQQQALFTRSRSYPPPPPFTPPLLHLFGVFSLVS
jgi:hypothetical protein